MSIKIEEYSTMRRIRSWPHGLLDDLFGFPDALLVLPRDFEGSLTYAISTLEPIKRELILARYKERLTFADIASKHSFGGERARQIIARGMRELRHPSRLRFIKYGVAAVMNMEKEMAAKRARERATDEAIRNYLLEKANEAENGVVDNKVILRDVLLEHIHLSTRTVNCLYRAGFKTIGDVLASTGDHLKMVRGFGAMSQAEVVTKLEQMGFNALHLNRPK